MSELMSARRSNQRSIVGTASTGSCVSSRSGSCCSILEKLADERVEICAFGLWNEASRRPLYRAGGIGATLFGDDVQDGQGQIVEVRRARDWFQQHVSDDDEVYLKLNCEGSECDILDDLLDSGEIRKVTSALVDFDVRKIPTLIHREGAVRERLSRAGYSNVLYLKERYKGPTHTATIENWLRSAGANPMRSSDRVEVAVSMVPRRGPEGSRRQQGDHVACAPATDVRAPPTHGSEARVRVSPRRAETRPELTGRFFVYLFANQRERRPANSSRPQSWTKCRGTRRG